MRNFNNIKVKDAISPSFKTVSNNYSAAQVLKELVDYNLDEAVITNECGNFCGLVTKKHLLRCLTNHILKEDMTIGDLMLSEPLVTYPYEDLNKAREKNAPGQSRQTAGH